MLIEIKHRWSGSVLFSLECGSIKEAVAAAIKSGSNLSGSNLRDSNLSGSDLSGSDLRGSDLRGSDLRGSDLRGSDLRGSDLRDSNLSGSNLSGSDLRGSDLRGSDLRGSDLSYSNLTPIRDDYWAVLSSAPSDVVGLRTAIIEGRIDGSTYTGGCACLVGTIAKIEGVDHHSLATLKPDQSRPAERFFLMIKEGDTPATNQASKIVLEWTDTWLAGMRAAFGSA